MLQPAAARLANAMIAVLGNDFTLGSAAYSRCKTLVTDNSGSLSAAAAAAAGGSGNAAAGGAGAAASGVPVAAGSAEGLKGLAVTWAELEQVRLHGFTFLFYPLLRLAAALMAACDREQVEWFDVCSNCLQQAW
jgi:hypothetical protein